MSNTTKHKLKGRWNNGFQDSIPLILFLQFRRHNSERGYFKPLTEKLKEKIMDGELKMQLDEN